MTGSNNSDRPARHGHSPPSPHAIAYPIPAAVKVSGISRPQLYRLIKSGELRSVKARGSRLILRADLEAYFDGLKTRVA